MTTPELIASYWTIAGGAQPHSDHEWSPFDFKDRVESAARAGFKGIGIWHADLSHVLEQRPLREMKRILDDCDIQHVELEFLVDWFVHGARRRASDERRRLLFEAAESLEARHIKVGDFARSLCPMPQLIDAFGSLCAEAAARGTKIVFELMPHSVIETLDEALTLIEGAGAANGGLIIDLWHMVKLGIRHDQLTCIPGRYFLGVEMNDGYLKSDWDIVEETTSHRKLCGQGEFDIRGFVAAVRESAFRGPIGIEVLSAELRQWPLDELTNRAFETTMAFLRPSPAT
jgi:sugar phosphate isomerase/epimerase